jgi:hypothetical protein
VDPVLCARCGERICIVAFLTDAFAICKILDHLGLRTPEAQNPPPQRESAAMDIVSLLAVAVKVLESLARDGTAPSSVKELRIREPTAEEVHRLKKSDGPTWISTDTDLSPRPAASEYA